MIYQDPCLNICSTEIEINKHIIYDFVIETLLPRISRKHPFHVDDIMLMTAAVCRFKPELILEWGTNVGYSARIFYEIIQAFDIKSKIHSIDLPDNVIHKEHPGANRGLMIKGIADISLHQGNGIDVALQIAKNNANNILFFLDGDHHYENVLYELRQIFLNATNPIILVHDTFYQSENSGYHIGPNRAVETILAENKTYKCISTILGTPGVSLIYKEINAY